MFVRSFTHRRLFTCLPVYLAPPDDSGQGAGESGSESGDGDQNESSGQTFDQAALDRIVGQRASQAERSARKALLEQLGVKDEAEAKKIVETARKAAEKDKTELERAQTKAAEHETAAQAAKREAAEAKLQLKIDRKLLAAKADPNRLERLSKTVFIDLDDDADDDAISAAIEAVKNDFPEAFTADESEKKERKTGPAPSGTAPNGKGPKSGGQTSDPLQLGRERARRLQGRDPATGKKPA